MHASFVELPSFERHRQEYLNDEGFRGLQNVLLKNPEAGDVIAGTGGLRKLGYADSKRGKSKRGGLHGWWRPISSGYSRSTTRTSRTI